MGVQGDYSLNSPHSGAYGTSVRPAVRPGRCPRTPPAGGAYTAGTPTRRAARSSFRTPLATPAPGGASFRTPPPNPRLLVATVRHTLHQLAFSGWPEGPLLSGLRQPHKVGKSRWIGAFDSANHTFWRAADRIEVLWRTKTIAAGSCA